MFNRNTWIIIFAIVVIVLAIKLFSMERPRIPNQQTVTTTATTPQASADRPGQCPKIEGSYFGVDKSSIKAGEPLKLSWKLPLGYETARIEGLNQPTRSSSITQSDNSNVAPGFFESSIEGVTPAETTRFILKAPGPEGCRPLELSATVEVQ